MDTNAAELLKPRSHAGARPAFAERFRFPSSLGLCSDTPTPSRNWSWAPRLAPWFAFRQIVLSSSRPILITLVLLPFCGCDLVQPAKPAGATLSAASSTNRMGEPVRLAQQPQRATQPQPAKPAPAHVESLSAKKRTPVIPEKGAEQLLAPSAPAPQVVSERTTVQAAPAKTATPTVSSTADPAASSDSTPNALIFVGPPRRAKASASRAKGFAWLGVGLGGTALGLGAIYYLRRRAKLSKVSAAPKEELVLPKELVLREPANQAREPFDKF